MTHFRHHSPATGRGHAAPRGGQCLTGAPADLEVLLVDDGSPDDTGALCDELAAADPRAGRCIVQTAARVRPAIPGWTPRTGTGCCFWMPTMRFYPVCGPRWTP